AHVERRGVGEQAYDLAVGHVHDRLAGLGIAVPRLGIGERAQLVERVQVRARQAEGLTLVEIRAQSDVSVRKCEHRLRLREHVEIEMGLAYRPRLDRVRRMCDHPRSSARSVTTTSAPCSRSAFACPTRSTPTTKPNAPAR